MQSEILELPFFFFFLRSAVSKVLSTRSLAVPLCFLKPDVNVASTKKPHIQKCMPGELSGHDHTASTGTHGLPGECLEAAFTSTRPQWSWNRVGGALCTVYRLVSVGRHSQPGSYEAQGAASLHFSFSWWPRLVDFWSVSPGFFIDSTRNLILSPYQGTETTSLALHQLAQNNPDLEGPFWGMEELA